MGKLKKVSRPYAPGGTGTVTTAYTENVTRVTSPAGKWKEPRMANDRQLAGTSLAAWKD